MVGLINPRGQLDYKVVTKLKLPIGFLVSGALWDQHSRHLAYIAEQSLVDRLEPRLDLSLSLRLRLRLGSVSLSLAGADLVRQC